MPQSRLQSAIAHYRAQLAAREQHALQSLAASHARTAADIQAHLDLLYRAVEAKIRAGQTVPVEWVLEQMRLYNIQQVIAGKINDYGAMAQHLTLMLQADGVHLGSAAAQALLQASLPPGVGFSFGIPSMRALESFVGATQAGSPLDTLFAGFGAEAAQAVKQSLLTGLTLGHNPRDVARSVQQDLNVAQYRAQTIARTEFNRAYRSSQLENYRTNSDVVSQWRWTCALSGRTCAACLGMDGSLHDLDEEMDSHPNCRCFPMPVTKSWADILDGTGIDTSDLPDTGVTDDMPTGAEWFAQQDAATQRDILGPAKYAAYSNGDITLQSLVGISHDKDWGSSIYERSLKDALKRTKARSHR